MRNNLINLEKYLQDNVLPDLEFGRPGFDKEHTLATVYYLKQILNANPQLDLDHNIMLIAAYCHDWGYGGLFNHDKKTSDYSEVIKAKAKHMIVGAEKLQKLLSDSFFSFLSTDQKQRCVHLVAVHDKLDKLKEIDELILMEADTLGALDVNLVKPTYDKVSNSKYIDGVRKKRIPKFITDYSKIIVNKLIQMRINYYLSKS